MEKKTNTSVCGERKKNGRDEHMKEVEKDKLTKQIQQKGFRAKKFTTNLPCQNGWIRRR